MDLPNLLTTIAATKDCRLLPPAGLPRIPTHHKLPEDLTQFYTLAGGLNFYTSSPYAIQILPPNQLLPANPIIVGQLYPEDISSHWYTIAQDPQKNFLTIDLNPQRLGRCYDSFFDRHAIVGSCAIIARSFTELLQKLRANQGHYWYWLEKCFPPIGDAYD